MKSVCKSVVAGTFYPADPQELSKLISLYLSEVDLKLPEFNDILGVIAPHAGYIYSGACAAYSYKAISNKDFKLAVIIAPSHQYGDFYYSVGDYDACATPLGEVEVDRELTSKLLNDSKFVFFPYAHSREHSLEVQLPFLQTIKPDIKILPIIIGYQYAQSSLYLSDKLAELLKDHLNETIIIISSDLSHYHDHKKAESMDKTFADAVEKIDTESVKTLLAEQKSEACGFGGILTLMQLARKLKYNRAKTLHYTHSGETSGDYNHVVGYLSTMFYR